MHNSAKKCESIQVRIYKAIIIIIIEEQILIGSYNMPL